MRAAFPFSAIVGQDEMKRALLIAAVDPKIGGVMVFGDRGTGKSTAARALAALLPPLGKGRPVPFIDLPLGATEDRVVGALDIERALGKGEKAFEPGLLAKADQGFLYIDEINLLEDHIVDLLLDVAASGENVVEREGLSVRHSARFVLIGSGNPEEGELRPQLLDRFGLSLEVRTSQDLDTRVEILRRCDAFERTPGAFAADWAKAEKKTLNKIAKAKKLLPELAVPDDVLRAASELCIAVGADGLRGELTLMRAARAAAALDGKALVGVTQLRAVAPMALRHRLRRNVLDETGSTVRIERALAELFD
jgi:magnesium chelatase subunit I